MSDGSPRYAQKLLKKIKTLDQVLGLNIKS